MQLNLFTTNVSFRTQSSYSHALTAPLNLCNKCSPDHCFWGVYTFQSDTCLTFSYALWLLSRRTFKSQNVEQVKTPLVQSTTGRTLIAQISKNFEVRKMKLLRKTVVSLLPSNQMSHHLRYEIKLTGFGICMK